MRLNMRTVSCQGQKGSPEVSVPSGAGLKSAGLVAAMKEAATSIQSCIVVYIPIALFQNHGRQHIATFHSASLSMYRSSVHVHP